MAQQLPEPQYRGQPLPQRTIWSNQILSAMDHINTDLDHVSQTVKEGHRLRALYEMVHGAQKARDVQQVQDVFKQNAFLMTQMTQDERESMSHITPEIAQAMSPGYQSKTGQSPFALHNTTNAGQTNLYKLNKMTGDVTLEDALMDPLLEEKGGEVQSRTLKNLAEIEKTQAETVKVGYETEKIAQETGASKIKNLLSSMAPKVEFIPDPDGSGKGTQLIMQPYVSDDPVSREAQRKLDEIKYGDYEGVEFVEDENAGAYMIRVPGASDPALSQFQAKEGIKHLYGMEKLRYQQGQANYRASLRGNGSTSNGSTSNGVPAGKPQAFTDTARRSVEATKTKMEEAEARLRRLNRQGPGEVDVTKKQEVIGELIRLKKSWNGYLNTFPQIKQTYGGTHSIDGLINDYNRLQKKTGQGQPMSSGSSPAHQQKNNGGGGTSKTALSQTEVHTRILRETFEIYKKKNPGQITAQDFPTFLAYLRGFDSKKHNLSAQLGEEAYRHYDNETKRWGIKTRQ